MKILLVATVIFLLVLPLQIALSPTTSIDLPLSRVLVPALILLWLIVSLMQRKLFVSLTAQATFLVLFVASALLSFAAAQNLEWAARKTLFLLTYAPLFFLVAALLHEYGGKAVKILTRTLVWSGALGAATALFQFCGQFVIGLDPMLTLWRALTPFVLGGAFGEAVITHNSWLVNVAGANIFRAVGFFPDPHIAAFFFGLIAPFAYALFHSERKKQYLIIFFILLCADILTFSRGGYIGLIAGAGAWMLCAQATLSVAQKRFAALALASVLLVLFIVPNPFSERLASVARLSEGSNIERLRNWAEAGHVIANNPAFGVGIGNYPLEIDPSATYRTPFYAHNTYLDVMAELGALGLFAWLAFLFFIARGFVRHVHHKHIAMAGTASIAIFATHSLVETPLFSVHVLPLLMVIAALSTYTTNNDD